MSERFYDVDAITIDFYNTLVFHKLGSGRGPMLMQYLEEQGLACDPWEHQVLYDVFERHATDYSPHMQPDEKQQYLRRFTARLIHRMNVQLADGGVEDHIENVWRVLGPSSLGVFPDVARVLQLLRSARYKLAVISNWQCGLAHFCAELGIAGELDHIIASAEVGIAKPDPGIFMETCRRLGVGRDRVLHVGDSVVDDIEGARNSGMRAVLIQRGNLEALQGIVSISSLDSLPELLGLSGEPQ